MKYKTRVIKFLEVHEDGNIPKYQHFILQLDYTACGLATDEYEHEKKIGYITCPDCIKLVEDVKKIIDSNIQPGSQ